MSQPSWVQRQLSFDMVEKALDKLNALFVQKAKGKPKGNSICVHVASPEENSVGRSGFFGLALFFN